MITYEEALNIARDLKTNIDNCSEETSAYIFGSHEDDDMIGGDGPVVVLKEEGEAINMTSYIDEFSGEKEIRSFDL